VPQLADAEQLLTDLGSLRDGPLAAVRTPVLVPNLRGLERALAHEVREVAVFVSATETFAQKNLNRTRQQVLDMSGEVVRDATAAGVAVRGYVSMCFGDPWEGDVDLRAVVDVVRTLQRQGCHEISLGDTIGVGTAGHVTALLDAFTAAGLGVDHLAMHFHDTYGQALANTYAALRAGVTTYDASAGGLGGCPYAHSATGNLATEDLVWMLHGLGIETGVDLDAVVATSTWLAGELGRPSPSVVVRALGGTAQEGTAESPA
jgi:hydroxymethylglutaryl-CoA lyase